MLNRSSAWEKLLWSLSLRPSIQVENVHKRALADVSIAADRAHSHMSLLLFFKNSISKENSPYSKVYYITKRKYKRRLFVVCNCSTPNTRYRHQNTTMLFHFIPHKTHPTYTHHQEGQAREKSKGAMSNQNYLAQSHRAITHHLGGIGIHFFCPTRNHRHVSHSSHSRKLFRK